MDFDRFSPDGNVHFLPATIDDAEDRSEPIPARFYSAHFAFTDGEFVNEVPHDPQYYFHGEEVSIAVRAFTHGYDLLHPHKIFLWHYYTRRGLKNTGMTIMIGVVEMMVHMLEIENYLVWTEKSMTLNFLVYMV